MFECENESWDLPTAVMTVLGAGCGRPDVQVLTPHPKRCKVNTQPDLMEVESVTQ